MKAYPDTSFLCAIYRTHDNSPQAIAWRAAMDEPLRVTRLLLWEFRQSARFHAFRHSHNRKVRYPLHEAERMIAKISEHIESGSVVTLHCSMETSRRPWPPRSAPAVRAVPSRSGARRPSPRALVFKKIRKNQAPPENRRSEESHFTVSSQKGRFRLMHALPADNLDFAWDRPETAETLRAKLATGPSPEWLRTAAWLMREARTDEVWQFLTLRQVADSFPQLSPMLGRRRRQWEHLLRAAHELGRL